MFVADLGKQNKIKRKKKVGLCMNKECVCVSVCQNKG